MFLPDPLSAHAGPRSQMSKVAMRVLHTVPLNPQPSVRSDPCDLRRPPSRVRKLAIQMLRALLPRGYQRTTDSSATPTPLQSFNTSADSLRINFQILSPFFLEWVTLTDGSELAGFSQVIRRSCSGLFTRNWGKQSRGSSIKGKTAANSEAPHGTEAEKRRVGLGQAAPPRQRN